MVCQFSPRDDSLEAARANGVCLIQTAGLTGFNFGAALPDALRMPGDPPADPASGPRLAGDAVNDKELRA